MTIARNSGGERADEAGWPLWLLKTPKAAESLEFWDSPP